jgi:hypothetical protein
MFELIILIFLLIWIAISRLTKAEKRLQRCIDNGKVIYDGIHIEFSENLTDEERCKLEKERGLFLLWTRNIRGIAKLHKRNSQY